MRGDDIPIGARILSVVDCYDALTSDRPYRRALDRDAAVGVLLERRGTMYDPLIVDTFIRILPEIAGDRAAARSAMRPRSRRSASRHRFRSRRRRRRLAAAGDGRSSDLTTCAVYLLSPDGRMLTVEHASGPLAAALTGMSIEVGQKLSGWVAAHRRTIVNSDAQLDLCDVVSERHRPPLVPEHGALRRRDAGRRADRLPGVGEALYAG